MRLDNPRPRQLPALNQAVHGASAADIGGDLSYRAALRPGKRKGNDLGKFGEYSLQVYVECEPPRIVAIGSSTQREQRLEKEELLKYQHAARLAERFMAFGKVNAAHRIRMRSQAVLP